MSLPTPDSPEQLPARMLNEFAYCPRLFYLEYVQQDWDHSVDTLEGRFVHRRVDQETGMLIESGGSFFVLSSASGQPMSLGQGIARRSICFVKAGFGRKW